MDRKAGFRMEIGMVRLGMESRVSVRVMVAAISGYKASHMTWLQ